MSDFDQPIPCRDGAAGLWRRPLSLAVAGLLLGACRLSPAIIEPGTASVQIEATTFATARHSCRRLVLTESRAAGHDDGRPKSSHQLASATLPITVHWSEPVPPAKAQKLLNYVEAAWQREVVELGWARPLPDGGKGGSDNLDIYLAPIGKGQAYVSEEKRQATPFAAAASFIAFDQQLADDGTLESYAFHEFNHACQYALDANEGDAFFENTAAFMDRFLKPDGPASATGVADFQGMPERSLDAISGDGATDEYEYGAGIFLQYLVERYGGGRPDLVRELWEAGRQPETHAADPNEPDWQDVLPAVLHRHGGPDAPTALLGFEAWRLQQALAKPARLPMPFLIQSEGRPTQLTPEKKRRPAPWGANFARLDTQGASNVALTLVEGGDCQWRLWVGVQGSDGSWQAATSPAGLRQPSVSLRVGAAKRVYVAVLNLGRGDHDPDRKDWTGVDYRLNLDWSK